jgi:hypothetical protein
LLTAFEQTAGPFVKPMRHASGVVELVEIAHRLHDRLEIRPRGGRGAVSDNSGCERWIAIRLLPQGSMDRFEAPPPRQSGKTGRITS